MKTLGPYLTYKTEIFKHNLKLAFPNRTETEIEVLAREIWGNFGAVLAEYPHMKTMCSQEAQQRIETVIKGDIQGTSVCYCLDKEQWASCIEVFETLFNRIKSITKCC